MKYKSMWILLAGLVGIITLIFVIQSPGPAPQRGEALATVIVPTLTQAQKAGETLYNDNCAACHGANAAGQAEVAPPFVHRVYVASHHGDGAFFAAAQNGVRAHHWPFGDMPPVEGVSQDDVAKIITYIRAIQSANGI